MNYEKLRVGVIVADLSEFLSIGKFNGYGIRFEHKKYFGYESLNFNFIQRDRMLDVTFALCGLGIANAAGLAGVMVADGFDIILNAGLSGAISQLIRDDIVLCDVYRQHDFDLTRLGYKPGNKGVDSASEFFADPLLLEHYQTTMPHCKTGPCVSGDVFVGSAKKREWIRSNFEALSCDMESAGIAAVCNKNKVPFLAIRRISDTADDVATTDYGSYANENTTDLFKCVIVGLIELMVNDRFWKQSNPAQQQP